MDKKNLLEEVNRMNYLFNHKRGVVISEQTPGELTGEKKDEKGGFLKNLFKKKEPVPSVPNWDGKIGRAHV